MRLFNPKVPLSCRFSVRMCAAVARTCNILWVPFKIDCEELLGRFQQTDSVRYEEFAAIWRAMNFSSVYCGMTTNGEKRPFVRLAFTTVYEYFLPPNSFQIRVGALYMFYGLYFTQPVWPKEKVWIALKDWMCVQNFVSDAVTCLHLDVVYIYRKLVSEKAFYYSAMPNQLTFDSKHRFKNKKMNDLFLDLPDKVSDLINPGTVEEIKNVQAHYERIKQALHVSTSVSVTSVNLSEQLQECAFAFQQWQEKAKKKRKTKCEPKGKKSTELLEGTNRADLLASIKLKSCQNLAMASNSTCHRQVEMDTSVSGTDHTRSPQRKKILSLKQRTCQSLGKGPDSQMKYWILSAKEEDKSARKLDSYKKPFKW